MTANLLMDGWLGPVCALFSSVTWAFGTTGYSQLSKTHSPFAINFSRGMIALPLFLLTALVSARLTQGNWQEALSGFALLDSRHLGWLTLSILSSYAIGDALFLASSRSIGIPAALTIASSYPLVTATWGALVLGDWLTLFQSIGLILTVTGVALVILSAPQGEGGATLEVGAELSDNPLLTLKGATSTASAAEGRGRGILLAFGAMAFWAVNSYAVTRGGQGISAPVGNSVRMAIAMMLCAGIGKSVAPQRRLFLGFQDYKKWLWLFVLEGFGGSYLFVYGLAHSPLAIGSTLASVAPVISVPIALVMGLERFSWRRTAGVLIVVFGLFLLVGGLK